MFGWYESDLIVLYPLTFLLITGAAGFGTWVGRRFRGPGHREEDIGTLTGAALGLLALLIAFSFSLALSRYETRRSLVLEEANAIGSTANYALMLPEPAQGQVLGLLRDYVAVRIGLGTPYDPARLQRDVTRSSALQAKLWQQAVAASGAAPQSLPVYQFVSSLNEMNNIGEKRLAALRFHVPSEVMVLLIGIAMVAMGFTGYHSGITGSRRPLATLIMSLMVSVVIMLDVDLDRPARGLIRIPVQPLVDTAQGMAP
jgi:hypothetical protein